MFCFYRFSPVLFVSLNLVVVHKTHKDTVNFDIWMLRENTRETGHLAGHHRNLIERWNKNTNDDEAYVTLTTLLRSFYIFIFVSLFCRKTHLRKEILIINRTVSRHVCVSHQSHLVMITSYYVWQRPAVFDYTNRPSLVLSSTNASLFFCCHSENELVLRPCSHCLTQHFVLWCYIFIFILFVSHSCDI